MENCYSDKLRIIQATIKMLDLHPIFIRFEDIPILNFRLHPTDPHQIPLSKKVINFLFKNLHLFRDRVYKIFGWDNNGNVVRGFQLVIGKDKNGKLSFR